MNTSEAAEGVLRKLECLGYVIRLNPMHIIF